MRPGRCRRLLLNVGFVLALTGIRPVEGLAGPLPDSAEVTGEIAADAVPTIGPDGQAPYPLNQVVDIDLADVTIRELGDWITEQFQVPVVYLEDDSYEGADWPSEVRVIAKANQQHLYTVMRRALAGEGHRPYRVCAVRDGALVIGPSSDFEDHYRIVHYDVSDLLDGAFDVESLQKILRWTTTGEWVEVDGIGGSIDHFRGFFIISQTDQMHQEIAHMLAVLRFPRVPALRLELEDDVANDLRLDQPINLELTDVPFDAAIAQFSEASGVPMRILEEEFVDNVLATDLPVSVMAQGITAEEALNAILESYAEHHDNDRPPLLTWYFQNGEIAVDVRRSSDLPHVLRLYDVSDFVQESEEQKALLQMLLYLNSGDWVEIDGIGGSVYEFDTGWVLFRNESAVLDEVEETIALWRSIGLNDPRRDRFPLPEPPSTTATLRYILHADTAEDLAAALPDRVAAGTWQDEEHPNAVGRITLVRLGTTVYTLDENSDSTGDATQAGGFAASVDPPESADGTAQPSTPPDAGEPAEEVESEEPAPTMIEFPAAMLIIEYEHNVLLEVTYEVNKIARETWEAAEGELRPLVPIEEISREPYFGDGGGFGGEGEFGFGAGAGGGFFQIP